MSSRRRICLTAFEATKHLCLTVPTVEGVKLALARFHREVLVKHPYLSAAILLLWSFYPQFPFYVVWVIVWVIPRNIVLGFLTCLGFRREGVRSNSIASRYQARRYGAYTPANSVFSGAQSYGAINHVPLTADSEESHPGVKVFWRIIGWLCVYASLVVLLKYGGQK